jgi:hypothetical protein
MNSTASDRLLTLLTLVLLPAALAQGPLTPPGPPAPTMKTLDQIEPRIPINAPTTIVARGSYYLTGNLSSLGPAIEILDSHVTLDLNGFELSGQAVPTNGGIRVSPFARNVTIRNGTIRNWILGRGIEAGGASEIVVEDVRATGHGEAGIEVGSNSVVRRCAAFANGNVGINVGANSRVEHCTASDNVFGGTPRGGIRTATGCLVADCIAGNNASYGIRVGAGSTVQGCAATANTAEGIYAGPGSRIEDCVVRQNWGGVTSEGGCSIRRLTVFGNSLNGIAAGIGDTVADCTVRSNGIAGIRVPNDCAVLRNTVTFNGQDTLGGPGIQVDIVGNRIEGNHAIFNDIGIFVSNGLNVIIGNTARYNGITNFSIVAGNVLGPVTNAADTANPLANFSF